MDSALAAPLTSLYRNCPWTGGVTAYPNLLQKRGRTPIVAKIPADDLFNPHYDQQIVLAGGTQRINSAFVQAITRIHWSVRLTALKR